MQKFRTKAKIKVLVLIFACIVIITIAGNISLAVNKNAIDQGVAGYFEQDLFVGSVFYIFPNNIILKDITVKRRMLSSDRSPLILPKISVRFFFWSFLFKGGLHVSDVTLYPSKMNYYALSQFLENNIQEILEIIKNSSGNDIRIRIKETLLDFDRKGTPDYIAMELFLVMQKGTIEGMGYFRADQYEATNEDGDKIQRIAKGWPLWVKWKGQLKSDGAVVDYLIFKSGNMYSKLWGSIRSGLMKVNGFMFMDTTKQGAAETDITLSRYFNNFSVDNEMPNIDVYVLDIDARVNLAFPDIEIERFNFSLNNIPITSNGKISLLDPPTWNGDLSFRHSRLESNQDVFFERADVHLTSVWKDKVLSSNGQININFIERSDLSYSPENAKITFTGLKYYFDRQKRATVDLTRGDIAYWINANEHRVTIHDFKAIADTHMEGLKNIELSALLYNGSLSGDVLFDSTQTPSRIISHITLNDVDTNALEELLVHFAKFNGRMTSTMEFTNVPQLNLSGYITMSDGQMTDFNFFNWVADSFRLPALKAIDFKKASAQFSINKEYIQMRNIRLKTDDVDIKGYFGIDHQNLVSSEITIALSQKLLSKSSKFKSVLKIFDEDDSHLNFDFRLSGSIDTMNFQWVPSEVKKKIQTRIPNFIERQIERNIDSLMESKAGK